MFEVGVFLSIFFTFFEIGLRSDFIVRSQIGRELARKKRYSDARHSGNANNLVRSQKNWIFFGDVRSQFFLANSIVRYQVREAWARGAAIFKFETLRIRINPCPITLKIEKKIWDVRSQKMLDINHCPMSDRGALGTRNNDIQVRSTLEAHKPCPISKKIAKNKKFGMSDLKKIWTNLIFNCAISKKRLLSCQKPTDYRKQTVTTRQCWTQNREKTLSDLKKNLKKTWCHISKPKECPIDTTTTDIKTTTDNNAWTQRTKKKHEQISKNSERKITQRECQISIKLSPQWDWSTWARGGEADRNEASICPGIFSRTLRFYNVASFPASPLPYLLDRHRKLVGRSAIPARSCPGPVRYHWGSLAELEVPPDETPGLMTLHPHNTIVLQSITYAKLPYPPDRSNSGQKN